VSACLKPLQLQTHKTYELQSLSKLLTRLRDAAYPLNGVYLIFFDGDDGGFIIGL
jgi:hypothetical protein